MRNAYIQPNENLTKFGQWLAARVPHTDIKFGNVWRFDPDSIIIRIYGLKPYCRFTVFDFTRVSGDWHLTIMGTRIKRNRHMTKLKELPVVNYSERGY